MKSPVLPREDRALVFQPAGEDPRVVEVARRHGRSAAQVLIRWSLQHDMIVIPKSTREARIRENASVYDFSLSPEDMRQLDGLNENLYTGWDPRDVR